MLTHGRFVPLTRVGRRREMRIKRGYWHDRVFADVDYARHALWAVFSSLGLGLTYKCGCGGRLFLCASRERSTFVLVFAVCAVKKIKTVVWKPKEQQTNAQQTNAQLRRWNYINLSWIIPKTATIWYLAVASMMFCKHHMHRWLIYACDVNRTSSMQQINMILLQSWELFMTRSSFFCIWSLFSTILM